MGRKRVEVPQEETWDLLPLYPNVEAWRADFSKLKNAPQEIHVFKGKLHSQLLPALNTLFSLSRGLDKLYTYAHLCHDVEITDEKNKELQELSLILMQNFGQACAYFEPEIFTLPNEVLFHPDLAPYKFHLEKLLRLKEHILSEREEELLALGSRALATPYKTFSSINNADFKFPAILDSNNKAYELTHGTYQIYLQGRDRILRENAFLQLHERYKEFENTLCDLIHGQILTHQFTAKARHYSSCLQAALKPKNIDLSVYTSLIEAVHEEIDALHAYLALRKKVLNIDLHLYDLATPLTPSFDLKIPYDKAKELVIESVALLGSEYQTILAKGLQEQRWVDIYENENKRSGAYSSGCFDSHPYVLMNYKQIVRDVFTLAHECGHSMHSHLSRKNQPYHYSDYPIFVAEVASTFNEELLFNLLLDRSQSKEEKIFYITSKIDDIRSTLFRQTQFAEFELKLHELVEKEIPLTPSLLHAEYEKLNEFYYGSHVTLDEVSKAEWARIPHFYYDFYVYQYATGISAALALVQKVKEEGPGKYLSFLKGGSSMYPIDLLGLAGVDMRTSAPVKAAISRFRDLVSQLNSLL